MLPLPNFTHHRLTMPLSLSLIFSLLLLLILLPLIPYTAGAHTPHGRRSSLDLVRTSCSHASYPALCLRTLSNYPGPPARTLTDLAQAAVKLSLAKAQKASAYLSAQLTAQQKQTRKRREKSALKDCREQVADAAAELAETTRELRRLKTGSFRWRMSNAQTWVSAALTCQTTCLDGLREVGGGAAGGGGGKVVVREDGIRRRIRNLSKVTSNALYLINLLDEKTKGKGNNKG